MKRDLVRAIENYDRAESERCPDQRRTYAVAQSSQFFWMLECEQGNQQTAGDREPRYDDVTLEDREKLRLRRIRVQRHRDEQRDHQRDKPEPSGGVHRPSLPQRRHFAAYPANRDQKENEHWQAEQNQREPRLREVWSARALHSARTIEPSHDAIRRIRRPDDPHVIDT